MLVNVTMSLNRIVAAGNFSNNVQEHIISHVAIADMHMYMYIYVCTSAQLKCSAYQYCRTHTPKVLAVV